MSGCLLQYLRSCGKKAYFYDSKNVNEKGDAMKLSAEQMAERRQIMLQTAFRLFVERNIDSVSMEDVAAETDYRIRSFYRYFKNKDTLVIETATWAFQSFTAENRTRNPVQTGGTAAGSTIANSSAKRTYSSISPSSCECRRSDAANTAPSAPCARARAWDTPRRRAL